VIGGGAAGFFSAINLAIRHPNYQISILEKNDKVLSKVRISGGGRCNVTNHCLDNKALVKNYPRGQKELLQVFARFSVQDTLQWFPKHGVPLKTEDDGRVFPASNSSESIINCFLTLASQKNINIMTKCEVHAVKNHEQFQVKTSKGNFDADIIIVASGGYHKSAGYDWLKNMGHNIDSPIPSLFTFNLPHADIKKELQGISVNHAKVSTKESKHGYEGPVLITHWGLSGPAVLKLSAFAAHDFYRTNYTDTIFVNWIHPHKASDAESTLLLTQKLKHKALAVNHPEYQLPKRLWEFLCAEATIEDTKRWAEIPLKKIRKLAQLLTRSEYHMEGKTTFKEEFVTCGGINLKEIDFKTMQSKLIPNLYFCGEVLNIDGITGGFNFQAAWSAAWVCANAIP
jgi:predicted Rossmann fold flavoprotein